MTLHDPQLAPAPAPHPVPHRDETALSDADLLAGLLRPVLTRQADRVARELLERCGDLGTVLQAGPLRLSHIAGLTPEAAQQLRLLSKATTRLARGRIDARDVIGSWAALIDYCRVAMAHRPREELRVLFLDRRNGLIADERMGTGTLDHVPVYPREVIRRALELEAGALILVHNHPSGDPTPSTEDIALTARIAAAAEVFGIVLHDHVVIARYGEVSFRAEGLLDDG